MQKNITLDFTAKTAVENLTNSQELAIMPASLAKKLLYNYSLRLMSASKESIIHSFKDSINPSDDSIEVVMMKCADFIQERTLINECAKENWDAFKVDVVKEPVENINDL